VAMTDEHWLPYESTADRALLATVVAAHRRFTKSLRYNLAAEQPMASLVLTDTEIPTAAYLLDSKDMREDVEALQAGTGTVTWTWVVGDPMPPLPPVRRPLRTGVTAEPGAPASTEACPLLSPRVETAPEPRVTVGAACSLYIGCRSNRRKGIAWQSSPRTVRSRFERGGSIDSLGAPKLPSPCRGGGPDSRYGLGRGGSGPAPGTPGRFVRQDGRSA